MAALYTFASCLGPIQLGPAGVIAGNARRPLARQVLSGIRHPTCLLRAGDIPFLTCTRRHRLSYLGPAYRGTLAGRAVNKTPPHLV